MTRDEFIESNLPLVHSLAARFKGRGIEYEELYSAGCVGLVKACDRFDESRGLCFSTYAVPVIIGEIKQLFRDGGLIKMSRSLRELSVKATRLRDELASCGREPHLSEIAEHLGITPEEAAEALSAGQAAVSLTDEEGIQFDVPQPSNEDSLIDRMALRSELSRLDDADKELMILRYFKDCTQSKAAEILGMTQVQVSRRERKILAQLREKLLC